MVNIEKQQLTKKEEAILKGAMAEFLAQGYAATSMDRIASTAGVSKATIYKYFQDKEQLFNALIERLAQRKFQTILSIERLPDGEQDPQTVLTQIAYKMIGLASGDRDLQNFLRIIIGESGRFPELARAYIHNIAKPGIKILTEYLENHPDLNIADPEATVRIFVGSLVYYIMLQELLYGEEIIPLEKERLVETLTKLIIRKD